MYIYKLVWCFVLLWLCDVEVVLLRLCGVVCC